jgi:hypothetical protein
MLHRLKLNPKKKFSQMQVLSGADYHHSENFVRSKYRQYSENY